MVYPTCIMRGVSGGYQGKELMSMMRLGMGYQMKGAIILTHANLFQKALLLWLATIICTRFVKGKISPYMSA